jgi:membrane-bound serine protease (ClpP class)
VLSMIGLTVIPFTWAGLLLIAAGGAMIIAEAHIGHGVTGLVGLAALVGGALLLFDTPAAPQAVSVPLVVGVAVVLGGGLVFVVNRTSKARHLPVSTGSEGLVGLHGRAREPLAPRGWVFVHGELWQAEAPEPIAAGSEVVVDAVRGLVLQVRPAAERGEV